MVLYMNLLATMGPSITTTKRVTVWRSLRRRAGADVAVSARAIIQDELLAERGA